MNDKQKEKIITLLKGQGYERMAQEDKKHIWLSGTPHHLRLVDMSVTPPQVCAFDGLTRIEEGHGISALDILKEQIANVLKANVDKDKDETKPKKAESKNEKDVVEGKSVTETEVVETIPEPKVIVPEVVEESSGTEPVVMKPLKGTDTVIVKTSPETANEIIKNPSKAEVVPVVVEEVPCEACGTMTDKAIAKKNFLANDGKALCKDCASGKTPNKLVVTPSTAMAQQYGMPQEVANLYFIELGDQLYIKNPGLLFLASKKGYERIHVEDKYDEGTETWEATCKIYPKLTKENLDGISKLDASIQKQALDFATQPTNGTGKANRGNVKMKTMHIYLREMAQTRATNRALRNYTGYGGTSMEELPTAELGQE